MRTIIFIFLFLFTVTPLSAAEVFFRRPQQLDFTVHLNTEGEAINAVKIDIQYPQELVVFKDYHDGNSIINLWVSRPTAKDNIISFEGLIPGGYGGGEGLLLTLRFETIREGRREVTFLPSSKVFLNDGEGTAANLAFSPLELMVSKEETGELRVSEDESPPEAFTPQVVRDPNVFGGRWFLVFATQDKGSGVARYEVREKPPVILRFSRWHRAESPYLLRDQSLKSIIEVRAVDNAGNVRRVALPPANASSVLVKYSVLIFIILGAAGFLLWRRFSK